MSTERPTDRRGVPHRTAEPAPWPAFRTLAWSMPAAFAPHIAEEYAAGFPEWVAGHFGEPMTAGTFLANNAVFMAILLGLTAWAHLRPGAASAFLLIAWASGNLFWNFVFHLATTVAFDRYSPGLVTATLLYLPLSVAAGGAALRERVLTPASFATAVAIGAGLMLIVMLAALYRVTP